MRSLDHDLSDPVAWGRRLIETRDIDPVYDMLWRAMEARSVGSLQVGRWMLAYWCLYHAGAASRISEREGGAYWDMLMEAAVNTKLVYVGRTEMIKSEHGGMRWPRATERRHWRGNAAISGVDYLRRCFDHPEQAVQYPADVVPGMSAVPLAAVRARAEEWPSFGPWISFKVADMLERVMSYPIEFPDDVLMYDSPRQGAIEAAPFVISDADPNKVVTLMKIAYHCADLKPPGCPNRDVNVQEIETVLCKWHSARKGHYRIGKDLREIREALAGWGTTAARLLEHLPKPLD